MAVTQDGLTIVRQFEPGDRYEFDFDRCSAGKGWAQVDTREDAWYYGTWAHPTELQIVNYAEGDLTITTAHTPEAFATELRRIAEWRREQGDMFGIDPGRSKAIREAFEALGLGDLLH